MLNSCLLLYVCCLRVSHFVLGYNENTLPWECLISAQQSVGVHRSKWPFQKDGVCLYVFSWLVSELVLDLFYSTMVLLRRFLTLSVQMALMSICLWVFVCINVCLNIWIYTPTYWQCIYKQGIYVFTHVYVYIYA